MALNFLKCSSKIVLSLACELLNKPAEVAGQVPQQCFKPKDRGPLLLPGNMEHGHFI